MRLIIVLCLLTNLIRTSAVTTGSLPVENSAIEYHDWRKPKNFASIPDFIGKKFWKQFEDGERKQSLIALATRMWQSQNTDDIPSHAPITINEDQIVYGKRNIILHLRMPDGSAWAARLHNSLKRSRVINDETERLANEKRLYESEVATMFFLQQTTSIPIPKIHGWDASYDNELRTPYMIMDFINGRTYPEMLATSNKRVKDTDLQHVHNQLTFFAWELAQHPFYSIGQLQFKDSSKPDAGFAIGAIIDRLDRRHAPFPTSRLMYQHQTNEVLEEELAQANGIITESVDSAKLFAEAAQHTGKVMNNGPFFIQHPDLHWLNMLLDDELNVVGLIDWEWAHTVPVESFNLLPWNGAAKMLPFSQDNVDRHSRNAMTEFQRLSEQNMFGALGKGTVETIMNVQQSPQRVIAECLHEYNYPKSRRRLYNKMKMALEELREG